MDSFDESEVTNVEGLLLCLCRTVEYANRDDMKNAIRKLDGTELNGRKLKLTEDRGGHSRYRRSVSPPSVFIVVVLYPSLSLSLSSTAALVLAQEIAVDGQTPGLALPVGTRTGLAPAPSPPGTTGRRRAAAGLVRGRTRSRGALGLPASLLPRPLLLSTERGREGRGTGIPAAGPVLPRMAVPALRHQRRRGVLLRLRIRR